MSFDVCPHHTPDAGGSRDSELHGVCIFCWRDRWAAANRRVGELEAEIAALKAAAPPVLPCDGCATPLGKSYFSDVPTPGGKKNLCPTCHTTRETNRPQP